MRNRPGRLLLRIAAWAGGVAAVELLAAGLLLSPYGVLVGLTAVAVVPASLVVGVAGLLVRPLRRPRRGAETTPSLSGASRERWSLDLVMHGLLLANAGIAGGLVLATTSGGPVLGWPALVLGVPGLVALAGAPVSVWLTWRTAFDRRASAWEAALLHRGGAVARAVRTRRHVVRLSLAVNVAVALVLVGQQLAAVTGAGRGI